MKLFRESDVCYSLRFVYQRKVQVQRQETLTPFTTVPTLYLAYIAVNQTFSSLVGLNKKVKSTAKYEHKIKSRLPVGYTGHG